MKRQQAIEKYAYREDGTVDTILMSVIDKIYDQHEAKITQLRQEAQKQISEVRVECDKYISMRDIAIDKGIKSITELNELKNRSCEGCESFQEVSEDGTIKCLNFHYIKTGYDFIDGCDFSCNKWTAK